MSTKRNYGYRSRAKGPVPTLEEQPGSPTTYFLVEYEETRTVQGSERKKRKLLGHVAGYFCHRIANNELKRVLAENAAHYNVDRISTFVNVEFEELRHKKLFRFTRQFMAHDQPEGYAGSNNGERLLRRTIAVEAGDGRGSNGRIDMRWMPLTDEVYYNTRVEIPPRSLPVSVAAPPPGRVSANPAGPLLRVNTRDTPIRQRPPTDNLRLVLRTDRVGTGTGNHPPSPTKAEPPRDRPPTAPKSSPRPGTSRIPPTSSSLSSPPAKPPRGPPPTAPKSSTRPGTSRIPTTSSSLSSPPAKPPRGPPPTATTPDQKSPGRQVPTRSSVTSKKAPKQGGDGRRRSESPKPDKAEERRKVVRAVETAVSMLDERGLESLGLPSINPAAREALKSWLKDSKEKIKGESRERN